jgi:hypothetical protein
MCKTFHLLDRLSVGFMDLSMRKKKGLNEPKDRPVMNVGQGIL